MALSQDRNDREYRKFDSDNRVMVNSESVPTAGNNPETILSFNAAKQLIYIDEVIAGTTYRQTVEGTGAKLIDDYVVVSTQTFGPAEEV